MIEKRVVTLFWFFISLFFVLILQLYRIGVTQSDKFMVAADRQQSYEFTIASRRGYIYDCHFKPITYRNDAYVAVVEPLLYNGDIVQRFKSIGNLDEEALRKNMETGRPFSVMLTKEIKSELGITVIKIKENRSSGLSHLLGSIDGDGNGVSGINKTFNDFLSNNGGEITGKVSLAASQKQLKGYAVSVFAQSYENKAGVALTIDKNIQEIAEKAADKYVPKGAIVISDINTGEIRAMVSRPNYDTTNVAQYLNSDKGELINRALTPYNVGSIFKIVVTAAALEKGTVFSQKTFCDGAITVGGKRIACHKEEGHGITDLKGGFINSCNPFFIECGLNLGIDSIVEMAQRFKIGQQKTFAYNIISQKAVLPDLSGAKPYALVANTAIGQGDLMLTPVDMLSVVNTVVNGGVYKPLSLIKGVKNSDNSFVKYTTEGTEERVIDEIHANYIKELLIATCNEGTGMSALPKEGGAGGKTATAETGWKDENGGKVIHGLFVGFFPAEKPKYSVAVVVENGRSGSASACPAFAYIADSING